jgi:hypothetical protein
MNCEAIKPTNGVGSSSGGQNINCQTGAGLSDTGGNEFINIVAHGVGLLDLSHEFYIDSSNCLVEGCEAYNGHGAGIQVQGNTVNSANNIIRNNIVHDMVGSIGGGDRRWGIVLSGLNTGTQVYNNVVYNIPLGSGYGIHIFHGDSTTIYFNTIYNAAAIGIFDDGGNSAVIRNNIAYNNGTNISLNGSSIASNNWTNTNGNPLFVNEGSHDFRLQAGSPCKAFGVAIGGISTDILGNARGNPPSVGAYE